MADRPKPLPTAVALRRERSEAPRVVASGRGAIAEEILAIAFEHGVRVREDADLVQLLATLELDSPIPVEAFAALAETPDYLQRAQASWPEAHPSGMMPASDSPAGAPSK